MKPQNFDELPIAAILVSSAGLSFLGIHVVTVLMFILNPVILVLNTNIKVRGQAFGSTLTFRRPGSERSIPDENFALESASVTNRGRHPDELSSTDSVEIVDPIAGNAPLEDTSKRGGAASIVNSAETLVMTALGGLHDTGRLNRGKCSTY